MGSQQSRQNDENATVTINRSEIPDEYRHVAVSAEVLDRVVSSRSSDSSLSDLESKLKEEREKNQRLSEQLVLVQSQRPISYDHPAEDPVKLEERKKIFTETMDRVEKQFFSYQRENACASNEEEIKECLNKNKSRLLNCASLLQGYEECVQKFHKDVLAELSSA